MFTVIKYVLQILKLFRKYSGNWKRVDWSTLKRMATEIKSRNIKGWQCESAGYEN